jgi:hypothetical protein
MTLARFVAACVLGLGTVLLGTNAGAQTIYQCGNEYTRVPCLNGRALDTADTRSAAQRAEAHRLLEDQRRIAAEMTRERRRNEAALKPALAGTLSTPPRAAAPAAAASAPKKPGSKGRKKRSHSAAADDDFVAAVPPAPRKKVASP